MDQRLIMGARARLRGLSTLVMSRLSIFLSMSTGIDYEGILRDFVTATGDRLDVFQLPRTAYRIDAGGVQYVDKEELQSKIYQLEQYIDDVYLQNDKIVQIGSVYNSIRDMELKNRCSDLLSARSNFDRVINQATLVLEDRIRKKISGGQGINGAQLVNTYIKSKLVESPIQLGGDDGEQEGYANLFRGMVGAFRNPTHHGFVEDMSRETALQIAGFVDHLLAVLASGTVK